MIKLKTILLEASKSDIATPAEYTGDNGNPNKINLKTVYGVTLESEAAANYKKMIDEQIKWSKHLYEPFNDKHFIDAIK